MAVKVRGYILDKKLGAGAMAEVYKGRQRSSNREVAIKVLHKHLLNNREVRLRFSNEASAMAGLSHPNIVRLFEFVEDKYSPALIMEFVNGKALDELIAQDTGAIPFERAISLFRQMLEGLSYAHARGMIHRDLKPSNIMITNDDKVKILDLGLALAEDSKRLTQVGAKMGTMYFMAPELFSGPNHSVQSDIYALAMTLYEMVSGAMPLESENQSDFLLMEKIIKEELPDPREYYPYIPNWVVTMLKKCLSKEASQRFVSCDEILLFIESNEGNDEFEPEEAPQPSTFFPDLQEGYYEVQSNNTNFHSNIILRSTFALIGSIVVYLIVLQTILGIFD